MARPDSPTLLLHSPPTIRLDLHTQQSVVSAIPVRLSALSSNSRLTSPRNVESGCDHRFWTTMHIRLVQNRILSEKWNFLKITKFYKSLWTTNWFAESVQSGDLGRDCREECRRQFAYKWQGSFPGSIHFVLFIFSSVSEDEWFGIEFACNRLQTRSVSTHFDPHADAEQRRSPE